MKKNTVNGYKAENAVKVLIESIESIRGVNQWAEVIGVSREGLYLITTKHFKKSPKIILREVKYEAIIRFLTEDIDALCDTIAREAGLPSEAALRMFLSRHHDINVSKLRHQIIEDKLKVEWKWIKVE